jgi:hypothetical protein
MTQRGLETRATVHFPNTITSTFHLTSLPFHQHHNLYITTTTPDCLLPPPNTMSLLPQPEVTNPDPNTAQIVIQLFLTLKCSTKEKVLVIVLGKCTVARVSKPR